MKQKLQQGFTLTELMIVVAIIGILASIAAPSYQDYIARSQVSEAIVLTEGLKGEVIDTYSQTGQCPESGVGGFPAPSAVNGKYVLSVQVHSGGLIGGCDILATMRPSGVSAGVQGKTVELFMTDNNGSLSWVCYSDDMKQKYLPKACKGV